MTTENHKRQVMQQINELVNRHYHSVAAYLTECDPWIPAAQQESMKAMLVRAAVEEKKCAEMLANEVKHLGGAVILGNYTFEIADLSYLSLDYCLDRAIAHKEETLSRIARLIDSDDLSPDLRSILSYVQVMAEQQIQAFTEARDALKSPPA